MRMPWHGVMLFAAGLGLSLAAGCGSGDGDVEGVDAAALLEAAAERMDGVETFHFRLTHQNGTTEIVRGLQMESAEGEVGGPDRLRVEVRARFATTNLRVEIVILPGESFITNPLTGRWEREEITVSQFFDPAVGVTALMRAVTDAEVTGRERVDGVETYRVEATVDSGNLALFAADAAPGTPMRARAWIGVDDPLVHRVEVEGALTPGQAANTVRRLELSAFDEPVEIIAPR